MKYFLMVLFSVISLVKGEAVVPKLRPGQLIQIAITSVPASEKKRLDATYSISKNGVLTMSKIGKIKAAGKTKSHCSGCRILFREMVSCCAKEHCDSGGECLRWISHDEEGCGTEGGDDKKSRGKGGPSAHTFPQKKGADGDGGTER